MTTTNNFQVIECSGSLQDIGRQYGEAARESLNDSLELLISGLAAMAQARPDDVVTAAQKYLPLAQEACPEQLDYIKGMGEGAGMSFENAFTLQCLIEMSFFHPKIAAGCTSFAAAGSATQNGETIVGQNIDWRPGAPLDLLHITHQSGLKQLSLCIMGNAYYTLTSAGLANSSNSTNAPYEQFTLRAPVSMVLAQAMRQPTLADALGVMAQKHRGQAYFHFADSQGQMFGIESVWDEFNIMLPAEDFLAHSNHYLTERFQKGDWACMVYPGTYLRAHRMQNLIDANHGDLTAELMMKLLADHRGNPDSICRHVDQTKPPMFQSESIASVVMLPEQGVMYISRGLPCEKKFVEYRL